MTQSDSLCLTLPLLQCHTELTAKRLWRWLIHQLIVCLSVMLTDADFWSCFWMVFFMFVCLLLLFCSAGSTPTWHSMTWYCTSPEASTSQLPLVLKSSPSLKLPGSNLSDHCALTPSFSLSTGVSASDLDASVKFEFPFPSAVRIFHIHSLWTFQSVYLHMCVNEFCVCVGGGSEGQNQHSKEHQQSRV